MTPIRSASGAHRTNKWYAFDASNERLSLFSPAAIGGFGLAVALGLFLIFPQKSLEEQLASVTRSDPLTIEYLKVFLAARPESPQLRLLLARQLMRVGRNDEARAAIAPFASAPMDAARVEAALLEFDMLEREAFALAPEAESRPEAIRAAAAQIRRLLAYRLTVSQMEFLARRTIALGDAATAVALYGRLAAGGGMRSAHAYAEWAELVLGLGGYDVAAQLYFRAQARSLGRKREYYMAGVRTLMAGNLYDNAIVEADRHIGELADDIDTLKFLARTAQAANRPDAAQRYARRLLRMAMLLRLRENLARRGIELAAPGAAMVHANWAGATTTGSAGFARVSGTPHHPELPFDEEAYTLGFDIFVGAGNLADAFRVAESAVQQNPRSAKWRHRLAQVSEWRGLPQVAIEQWLAHARLTGEEASWDAVLRLARGLANEAALLAVLTHKVDRDSRRVDLLDEIIALHEHQGNPGAAIAFLQARTGGAERRRNLERLAALAGRAGRDDLAFDTWNVLQREFGPSLLYANHIATRLYLTGDLRGALAALEAAQDRAVTGDTSYWQMVAELARLLAMDEKAIAGYRRLLESEKYSEGDLLNLIAMLDAMRPEQAARVAEFAFAKFRRADLALQVIYQYTRAGSRAAIARFLAMLPASTLTTLERDTRFLTARAAHHQAGGDSARALADFIAADALEPRNAEFQAAILWLLIGQRDTVRLKSALIAWGPQAEREARLWGPFAAAHMALNRQAEALRWFRRQAENKGDYLWLMAFAECLDANSQTDLAWRIRRHVWVDLRRPEVLAAIPADQLGAMRDRLASVSQIFAAGDGAKALVEALLRADLKELRKAGTPAPLPATGAELAAALSQLAPASSAVPVPVALPGGWFRRAETSPALRFPAADNDATVKELALAWALNNDAQELARAWLVTRYAATLARPLWGELSVALAGADRDTLTRLLEDLPDWLPMYDRVEAAVRIGRPRLAQTLAFDQLLHLQADEELHLRFTNLALEDPARVAGAVVGIRQSPLAIAQTRIEASADLMPRLKLGLTLTVNRQSTQDETVLVNVPRTDATAAALLRYRTERGPLTLTLSHRMALREVAGARLSYDLALAPRLRLSGSAGINQLATETALLRVGAMKSGFDNNITWSVSNREYLRAGLAWNRFHSQSGADLGRSTVLNLEAGHRFRIEYPDLTLRWFGTRAILAATPTSDTLMAGIVPVDRLTGNDVYLPSSYSQWGLAAGWGMSLQERYTRALRPFFDFSVFHNSLTGRGRGVRLGLAGSVAGQDHAVFYFSQSTGTPGAPQGLREFGLTYQWFY